MILAVLFTSEYKSLITIDINYTLLSTGANDSPRGKGNQQFFQLKLNIFLENGRDIYREREREKKRGEEREKRERDILMISECRNEFM